MWRRAEARAAAEQLGHCLFVRDRPRATGSHPLPMSLQYGVSFCSLELVWRCKALQCPELPVLVHGYHDGNLAT